MTKRTPKRRKAVTVKAWAIVFTEQDGGPVPLLADVGTKGYPYLLFDKRDRAYMFMRFNNYGLWPSAWKVRRVEIREIVRKGKKP